MQNEKLNFIFTTGGPANAFPTEVERRRYTGTSDPSFRLWIEDKGCGVVRSRASVFKRVAKIAFATGVFLIITAAFGAEWWAL